MTKQLVGIAIATAALVTAVLLDSAFWFLDFRADDADAAATTLRLVLAGGAVALVAFALSRGSGLWVDTLLMTAIVLAVVALATAYWNSRDAEAAPKPPPKKEHLTFVVERSVLKANRGYSPGEPVVFITILREQGESGEQTYDSHRYMGWFNNGFELDSSGRLALSIERGNDDETAQQFARDLQQLSVMYATPKPT